MSPVVYRGTADVARWCGVSSPAVSQWAIRHPDSLPEPDALIVNEDSNSPTRGWGLDRKDEWMAFAAARLAARRGPPSTTARRRTAELITRQAETGEITESTAIKLLASLIGTAPVTTTEGPS